MNYAACNESSASRKAKITSSADWGHLQLSHRLAWGDLRQSRNARKEGGPLFAMDSRPWPTEVAVRDDGDDNTCRLRADGGAHGGDLTAGIRLVRWGRAN